MKIYTRKGDTGETSLFGGRRVPKDDPRVDAYGTVDELNSALGFVIASLPGLSGDPGPAAGWTESLTAIQRDCFTIGALLATPGTGEDRPAHIPELPPERVSELEGWIDRLEESLPPLRAFILPGGGELAARLHMARAVCRRAERAVVALSRSEEIEPIVLEYLNRLGDLLFVLARAANRDAGRADVVWRPGKEEER